MKNKSWFEKILRHFQKTIRHFQKTIRRFQKTIRHFQKTTRRLKRSQYSITQHDQLGYEQQVRSVSENRCEIIVEYFLFSRAYAYIHKSFIFFAVTAVTVFFEFPYFATYYGHLSDIFYIERSTGQNRPITPTRNTLFALSSYLFSPPFLSLCDTCDSKKTKLL